jgi:hypothetical protein
MPPATFHLALEDALQLVHLYAERGSPKYEKAAMRWLEEDGTWRQAMIPADELNPHMATARVLSDDEVDVLTVRRFESFRERFDG